MKYENGRIPIDEFIILRSKMYSTRYVNKKEKSTHKGYTSYISNDKYYDTLFNKKFLRHKMTRNKSIKHKILTHQNDKPSTSCYDE